MPLFSSLEEPELFQGHCCFSDVLGEVLYNNFEGHCTDAFPTKKSNFANNLVTIFLSIARVFFRK
jgi:hypothetical protein